MSYQASLALARDIKEATAQADRTVDEFMETAFRGLPLSAEPWRCTVFKIRDGARNSAEMNLR